MLNKSSNSPIATYQSNVPKSSPFTSVNKEPNKSKTRHHLRTRKLKWKIRIKITP